MASNRYKFYVILAHVKGNPVNDRSSYVRNSRYNFAKSVKCSVNFLSAVPPKIMPIPPLTNLLQEGNRAGITCQVVEGDLPINFRWEKSTPSGRSVELGAISRRIDEYTSSLIIEKITPSHSGNYTCVAQNNAGEERLTVPVTVNGKIIRCRRLQIFRFIRLAVEVSCRHVNRRFSILQSRL